MSRLEQLDIEMLMSMTIPGSLGEKRYMLKIHISYYSNSLGVETDNMFSLSVFSQIPVFTFYTSENSTFKDQFDGIEPYERGMSHHVEEVLADVPQHSWKCRAEKILDARRPSRISSVSLQVIYVLGKNNLHLELLIFTIENATITTLESLYKTDFGSLVKSVL